MSTGQAVDDEAKAFFEQWTERLQFRDRAAEASSGLAADPVGSFLGNPWISTHLRYRSLTLEERFAHLLQLANDGRTELAGVYALASGSVLASGQSPGLRGTINADLKNEIRALLQKVASTEGEDAGIVARDLGKQLQQKVVSVPDFSEPGKLTYRHFALDTIDALRLSVALLCTSSAAQALCQCAYRECGIFYFATREHTAGRLRRQYCCVAHRGEEHRIRTRERVSAFRAKKRSAKAARSTRRRR